MAKKKPTPASVPIDANKHVTVFPVAGAASTRKTDQGVAWVQTASLDRKMLGG